MRPIARRARRADGPELEIELSPIWGGGQRSKLGGVNVAKGGVHLAAPMNIAHHLSISSSFFISYRFRPFPGIIGLGKRRSSLKLASPLSKRITRCQIDGVS